MALDSRPIRLVGLFVVGIVLLASIGSYATIPSWESAMGLDLRNLVVFHHCAARQDPYLATGAACGDPLGRAMPYPPLMYWAFVWTRWVPMPQAHWIWAAFVAVGLLLSGAGCIVADRTQRSRWPEAVVVALLLLQYPATFAMERGNNDVVVLLLWTGAVLAFVRERPLLAGCAAGAAAAAKVYPAIGCAILLAGAAGGAFRRSSGAPQMVRLAAGIVLAPVVVALAFAVQTWHYVAIVVPVFARHLPAVTLHSHSVPATFGAAAPVVSALVVLAWGAAAALRLRSSPIEIFAGALAASTYVAGTSFDYNLITAYPLLLVQVSGALTRSTRDMAAHFAVVGLGLVAIVGHRGWFEGHATAHVALQIAWLLVSAALSMVGSRNGGRTVTADPRELRGAP